MSEISSGPQNQGETERKSASTPGVSTPGSAPGSAFRPSGVRRWGPMGTSGHRTRSVRMRVMAYLLGLTAIAVLTIGTLSIRSIQSALLSAQQVSSAALREQAEETIRRVTVGDAQRNDLVLRQVQQNAGNVARYAAGIFETPTAFAVREAASTPGGASYAAYWRAEDHMFTGPDGQYMSRETDVSDAFVPNTVSIDEQLLKVLDLTAYLDFILAPTYESNPNTVAMYLGTREGILRYYPNIHIGAIVPADFQVTQRPWYIGATPENNPARAVVWSPVYADATGKGLMVTAAAPVYGEMGKWVNGDSGQDEFLGVVGIDVTLKDIGADIAAARLLGSGYSFLVDSSGHAIVLPEQGYQDILGRPPQDNEFGTNLSGAETTFALVLNNMMAGSTGFDVLVSGGKELFIAYAPLESTGWSMANVVEAERATEVATTNLEKELEASTRTLLLGRILPASAVILVVVVVLGLVLTSRLVRPIRALVTAAQRIGTGEWDVALPRPGNDEIGKLAQAFATMTAQLRELLESLEQRVAERTRALQEANYALQRRAIHLETSAEVGQAITSIFDVDELLRKTVELIRDRFGFYHAGIFLLDESGEWAVLREATGEAGAQMKAQGHRLAVADTSMVGWTALHHQPRIALDVGKDAVRFANPLLPYTHSEMTLPLIVGEQLLGVLNVQSTEMGAFDEEDVRVLQAMANQVAVAIENARKFSNETLLLEATSPIYRASRRLAQATSVGEVADVIMESVSETGADGCTVVEFEFSPADDPEALVYRGVWRRGGAGERGREYTAGTRLPIGESPFPFHMANTLWTVADLESDRHLPQNTRQMLEATGTRALVNIPLRAREKVIGHCVVERATPGPFSDAALRLYEALSNQAAVALERAQLWEETQRHAEQEQMARQMIDRIRRAVDIEQALQTAAKELSLGLRVPHVSIELRLDPPGREP